MEKSNNTETVTKLARIFHPNSAAACESLMQTALDSGLGLSGMSNTALRRNPRPPCLHHAARRLATNRYEISGLELHRWADHLNENLGKLPSSEEISKIESEVLKAVRAYADGNGIRGYD